MSLQLEKGGFSWSQTGLNDHGEYILELAILLVGGSHNSIPAVYISTKGGSLIESVLSPLGLDRIDIRRELSADKNVAMINN